MATALLLSAAQGPGPLLTAERARRPTRRRAAAVDGERAPTPPPPPPPPPPRRERHISWLRRGAPDAPGSPFHELGLANLDARAPKRRNYALLLREDEDEGDDAANAAAALAAALSPPPSSIFLDVGCGSGRFLLLLARRLRRAQQHQQQQQQQQPMMMMMRALLETAANAAAAGTPNPPPPLLLLGIDAQPALVERASAWSRALEQEEADEAADDGPAAAAPPPRCRFVAGDAPRVVGALGAGGGALAATSPSSPIVGASINFPDPVLMVLDERRRRLGGGEQEQQQQQQSRLRRCPALSEDFARLLGTRMAEGAPLLVQSECGRTCQAIVDVFAKSGAFEVVLPPTTPQGEGDDGSNDNDADPNRPSWCWPFNPLGVPTEREVYLAERLSLGDTEQGRVWRAVFRRR
jgi:SAM-dependent methyltransferase